MDEFGETTSIYVWPKGHEEGTAIPEEFWGRLTSAMESAGIEWEAV